ncbi:hypothetical protein HMPREF1863_01126 [Aedoeadaptatus coxii]|uniref:Uncharacterized protein n=1 Tax=Aedoeadaptatus coxii TaxID=755172 RepID=A0A134AF22_9FIRM|nr:hypothetical protein HMPREF1863_01126 [Peptoniphilus coxii]
MEKKILYYDQRYFSYFLGVNFPKALSFVKIKKIGNEVLPWAT